MVNQMLISAGKAKVASLTPPVSPNVTIAEELLDDADRKVQVKGWYFNTERRVVLSPAGGVITVGGDIMSLDITEESATNPSFGGVYEVTLRGVTVFNLTNGANTDQFTSDITVDQIRFLDMLTELPSVAQDYIAARATSEFVRTVTNNEPRTQQAIQREQQAHVAIQREHARTGDFNSNNARSVFSVTGSRRR
jgi:hypothetical protein